MRKLGLSLLIVLVLSGIALAQGLDLRILDKPAMGRTNQATIGIIDPEVALPVMAIVNRPGNEALIAPALGRLINQGKIRLLPAGCPVAIFSVIRIGGETFAQCRQDDGADMMVVATHLKMR